MRPYRQLRLTLFLTSFLAFTSPLKASDSKLPLATSSAAIMLPRDSYNWRANSQKKFIVYFFAGLTANYLSKEFGRDFINNFLEVPKGGEKSAVLSVALKSFWNDVWKKLYATQGMFTDISFKDSVNGMAYSAGNKLMSVLEFNRYMWNAWHEWIKAHKAHFSSQQEGCSDHNKEVLLNVQADWYWALWHMIYNQDYSGLQEGAYSFSQDPINVINGILWLGAAYSANVFAQYYSDAGQQVLAQAIPALNNPLLAKPLNVIIGFSFAYFLKEYVEKLLLETPLSYFDLYDRDAQHFYDRMYWAGNKGPFAWDGAKAIKTALVGGFTYLKNYYIPKAVKQKQN